MVFDIHWRKRGCGRKMFEAGYSSVKRASRSFAPSTLKSSCRSSLNDLISTPSSIVFPISQMNGVWRSKEEEIIDTRNSKSTFIAADKGMKWKRRRNPECGRHSSNITVTLATKCFKMTIQGFVAR